MRKIEKGDWVKFKKNKKEREGFVVDIYTSEKASSYIGSKETRLLVRSENKFFEVKEEKASLSNR